MIKQVKWYFDLTKWIPSRDEWLKLTQTISQDELDRINRFVFQDDTKSSLIGQALIRGFVSQALDKPSNELKLVRNSHGRPGLCKHYKATLGDKLPRVLDFNVSHSGNYCVLSGIVSNHDNAPEMTVGVDVTKIVSKNKQELDRFLMLMSKREFLPREWAIVEQASSDREKCINFTRLWCLKESFIKSIGLGLSFGLSRIQFIPTESSVPVGSIIGSTRVLVDDQQAPGWKFQETALDHDHMIALGYNMSDGSNFSYSLDTSPFQEITLDNLLPYLSPIKEANDDNWQRFSIKSQKNR